MRRERGFKSYQKVMFYCCFLIVEKISTRKRYDKKQIKLKWGKSKAFSC